MILFSNIDFFIVMLITMVFMIILGLFEAYFFTDEGRIKNRSAYFHVSIVSFIALGAFVIVMANGSVGGLLMFLFIGAIIRYFIVKAVYGMLSKREEKIRSNSFNMTALKVLGLFFVGEVILNVVGYLVIAITQNSIT